jgi:hypothetical protein
MNRSVVAALIVLGLSVEPVAAQSLGIFRWQTQPFCNVLILNVTASASAYRLEGTDDQCGGPPASVIGMAFPHSDGSIGVGLTAVFSGAVSLHIDATLLPGAGFNGSWQDSVGRNGTLLFTPGGSIGGPVRPVVAPLTTYGSIVAQPPNGFDRGFSAAVATDTGAPNDAAGLYGRFGGALAISSAAPAGVRGDSATRVGVYGLTDSGFGVAGGASSGVGVQGYAGATGIALQAVNLDGGTALEVRNGAIRVSGDVRAAFRVTVPGTGGGAQFACTGVSHPLLDSDPAALVFVTPHFTGSAYARYEALASVWSVCGNSFSANQVSLLVIKQ